MLGLALALTCIAAILELAPYTLLAASVAILIRETATTSFLPIMAWTAAALLVKYIAFTSAYYLSHRSAYRLLMEMRQLLVRRLTHAPLGWLQAHGSGVLKKVLMQDVEKIEQFVAHHLVEMTAGIVAPVVATVAILWIDWRLAFASLATAPLAILFQSVAMRGIDRRIAEYQTAIGELNGASVEFLRNMPVMKTFRQDARSFGRIREALERYRLLVVRVTKSTVPGWSIFTVLVNANVVFILPTGLWLLEKGRIDVAQLLFVLVLGSGMLKPLLKLVRFQTQIRDILDGVRRMKPMIDMVPPPLRSEQMIDRFDIELDAVRFAYDRQVVLDGVTFVNPAGRLTALVGPSGGGKSTIVQMLGGLIEANQGDIRIGDTSLATIGEAQRARLITTVTQDVFLFRDSVLDNLRLGRPDADEKAVRLALRIAQAERFVDTLPEGLHTEIGERGITLSGGERQRLAIARALLANTPILVLDECTAFADALTERRFLRALRESHPTTTILIVAHRLYAVKDADQIVILHDGRVSDVGRHDDLYQRSKTYAAMWEAQTLESGWTFRQHSAAPDGEAVRV